MERAVVLIGVARSGGLPALQAVARGLDAMRKWAGDQHIPPERCEVLTDEHGSPVHESDVFDAVKRFVELHTVEQLVIYFSGHGVNNNGSEYWLLSEAPDNPNEAVNVARSMRLAERCGIPHVVLVSDACRTAPASIQADDVTGSAIFPNVGVGAVAVSGDVDIFYACRLGEPAYEIADPWEASHSYRALYTEVLAEALDGAYADLRERVTVDGETYDLIRPYPLRKALPDLVTRRIIDLKATMTAVQVPDGKVCSDPGAAWLSRLSLSPGARAPSPSERVSGAPPGPLSGGGGSPPPQSPSAPPSPRYPAPALYRDTWWRSILRGRRRSRRAEPDVVLEFDTDDALEMASPAPRDPARDDAERAVRLLDSPPDLAGTEEAPAALRVRGTTLTDAEAVRGALLSVDKDVVRLVPAGDGPTPVLVRIGSGHCALVPAFGGCLGTLTVENDRLVDVSYVNRESGWPGTDPEYRHRRAWMAAASRYGISWGEETPVEELLDWHAQYGGADPSLDVYLAHALADRGRRDLVTMLLGEDDVPALYDVWLLAREQTDRPVVPPVPLLARSWALLRPAAAQRLPSSLPSHWTLFPAPKLPQLRELLGKEGVM
ncbi:caspase family protein [Streptomyces flavochromogenes]|uniref:caspase family protein n=1 Tax=Streptomyces flavochromogenes TaxID=68199 RepID=UPI000D11C4B2|nr:caspase family protein [Streptomyces flavochromogenes]